MKEIITNVDIIWKKKKKKIKGGINIKKIFLVLGIVSIIELGIFISPGAANKPFTNSIKSKKGVKK